MNIVLSLNIHVTAMMNNGIFYLGKVCGEVMTVRFSYRGGWVRIFGAAFWWKGKKRYEKENRIHR